MILSILVGLLLIPVTILAVKELISFLRLKYYIDQGFIKTYYPIIGPIMMIVRNQKHPTNGAIVFEEYTKQIEENDRPGFVLNDLATTGSVLFVTDEKLNREIFMREPEYLSRVPHMDFKLDFGFFFQAGQKGLMQRAIFSEAFKLDNIDTFIKMVFEILHKDTAKIGCDSESGRLKIENSYELLDSLFTSISQAIIFGSADEETLPKGPTEKALAAEFKSIMTDSVKPDAFTNPLNLILFNYPHKKEWLSGSKSCGERARFLEKGLKKYYQERLSYYADNPEKTAPNNSLVEILAEHNSRAPAENRMTVEESIGSINIFILASFDTTSSLLASIFFHLAQDPALQEKVRAEIDSCGKIESMNSLEALDKLELLGRVVQECLRVHPPSPTVFPKTVMKEMKIGKYTFRKGDTVWPSFYVEQWSKKNFPSRRQFDIDAINDSNKKKMLPFSSGRRGCVGKLLADYEARLLSAFFVSNYEIIPLAKWEDTNYKSLFAFELTNAKVGFVRRNLSKQ